MVTHCGSLLPESTKPLSETNFHFSSVKLCGIPLRATSQWVPKLLFCIMSLNCTFFKIFATSPTGQCSEIGTVPSVHPSPMGVPNTLGFHHITPQPFVTSVPHPLTPPQPHCAPAHTTLISHFIGVYWIYWDQICLLLVNRHLIGKNPLINKTPLIHWDNCSQVTNVNRFATPGRAQEESFFQT